MKEIIETSKSLREVVDRLGWKQHDHNYKLVKAAIEENNWQLNSKIDEVSPIGTRGVWKTTSTNDLRNAIAKNHNWRDVARSLGLGTRGTTVNTIKQYCDSLNIDTSHFTGKGVRRIKSNDDLFVEDSNSSSSVIRNRIIKYKLIKYVCSSCGILPEWNNQELVLQLEYIDGDSTNNTLSNLTFLCPNCHSQTSTWGRKTRKNISTQ